MTELKGFSEAARLYAKNIDLVQAMEKEYRKDVDKCVEALEARDRALCCAKRIQL